MDITHAIIIESYHKCRMVKFQRWGRILDLEVEFITPTHDLFFLHFFTLERMSDIVLWHSNFYFYFITLHALYSAKGDITFLAGKKVIKIVYLCNTIKFSIVVRCSFFGGGIKILQVRFVAVSKVLFNFSSPRSYPSGCRGWRRRWLHRWTFLCGV